MPPLLMLSSHTSPTFPTVLHSCNLKEIAGGYRCVNSIVFGTLQKQGSVVTVFITGT